MIPNKKHAPVFTPVYPRCDLVPFAILVLRIGLEH